MSERVHLLAQSILGKPTLEECNLEEIRELVQRYPYFAPAQFLYLQKLKSENAKDYAKQLQKAVLYYHNPLAFEYFISSDRFTTDLHLEEPAETHPHVATIEVSEPMVEEIKAIATPSNVNTADAESAVQESVFPESKHTIASQAEVKNQTTETELSFEPYHTVDYFASQGIKLSQEEVSKDKFGKQLKSFTEWLKTMKRLPAQQVVQLDTSTERKVEHLAEDSVHNADVITEAMAEVWLKQGNREKAIETYNKLSLLNPSKRAYFAALIENLKHS